MKLFVVLIACQSIIKVLDAGTDDAGSVSSTSLDPNFKIFEDMEEVDLIGDGTVDIDDVLNPQITEDTSVSEEQLKELASKQTALINEIKKLCSEPSENIVIEACGNHKDTILFAESTILSFETGITKEATDMISNLNLKAILDKLQMPPPLAKEKEITSPPPAKEKEIIPIVTSSSNDKEFVVFKHMKEHKEETTIPTTPPITPSKPTVTSPIIPTTVPIPIVIKASPHDKEFTIFGDMNDKDIPKASTIPIVPVKVTKPSVNVAKVSTLNDGLFKVFEDMKNKEKEILEGERNKADKERLEREEQERIERERKREEELKRLRIEKNARKQQEKAEKDARDELKQLAQEKREADEQRIKKVKEEEERLREEKAREEERIKKVKEEIERMEKAKEEALKKAKEEALNRENLQKEEIAKKEKELDARQKKLEQEEAEAEANRKAEAGKPIVSNVNFFNVFKNIKSVDEHEEIRKEKEEIARKKKEKDEEIARKKHEDEKNIKKLEEEIARKKHEEKMLAEKNKKDLEEKNEKNKKELEEKNEKNKKELEEKEKAIKEKEKMEKERIKKEKHEKLAELAGKSVASTENSKYFKVFEEMRRSLMVKPVPVSTIKLLPLPPPISNEILSKIVEKTVNTPILQLGGIVYHPPKVNILKIAMLLKHGYY